MNRLPRIILRFGGLTALLALAFGGVSCSRRMVPTSPIVFGRSAPTATNAGFVSITFTNESDSKVVYLLCPAQTSSNGIWSGPTLPPGQRLTMLSARQSGVVTIPAAWLQENVRVPVLWGYHDYTPGAGRWQQIREDFVARFHGHGGVGFLYTNYLGGLKP